LTGSRNGTAVEKKQVKYQVSNLAGFTIKNPLFK